MVNMKKISAFLTAALSAVLLSITASAQSDFLYAVKEDGTAVITEFIGYEADLVIPSELDGYTVSEIGSYCFERESGLRTLEIPSSVKIISEKAFSACYGLETVKLSEGLEEIKEFAFSECSYLREIVIPDSVQELGEASFKDCTYLKTAVIGKGVTKISESAFENCYVLENLTLSDNVTEIGKKAFDGAVLPTVHIPASVRLIEAYAFNDTGIMNVNYGGTESQWEKINFTYGNSDLEYAKVRFMVDANGNVDKSVVKKNMGVILIYVAVVAAVITAVLIILVKTRKRECCPYCNTNIEEGSEFCGNCGSKL